ncbi:hypothetical protein DFH06DRAFT_1131087 [Mycena polygramma]|nr:hypothetical protein DFH06DRAFT_1131087 [Mycena polygramma]
MSAQNGETAAPQRPCPDNLPSLPPAYSRFSIKSTREVRESRRFRPCGARYGVARTHCHCGANLVAATLAKHRDMRHVHVRIRPFDPRQRTDLHTRGCAHSFTCQRLSRWSGVQPRRCTGPPPPGPCPRRSDSSRHAACIATRHVAELVHVSGVNEDPWKLLVIYDAVGTGTGSLERVRGSEGIQGSSKSSTRLHYR